VDEAHAVETGPAPLTRPKEAGMFAAVSRAVARVT
jgi:hypothetical protein